MEADRSSRRATSLIASFSGVCAWSVNGDVRFSRFMSITRDPKKNLPGNFSRETPAGKHAQGGGDAWRGNSCGADLAARFT